jgi:hypothetical protein
MASRRRQYAPSSRNCWPVPTPISSSPAVCLTARCSIQLLTLGLQSDYASIALGLLDYNSSAPRLAKSPKPTGKSLRLQFHGKGNDALVCHHSDTAICHAPLLQDSGSQDHQGRKGGKRQAIASVEWPPPAYGGKPMSRSTWANRVSERKLSKVGSTLIQMRKGSRSSPDFRSHSNAWSFSPRAA